jgi:hypothetical protein
MVRKAFFSGFKNISISLNFLIFGELKQDFWKNETQILAKLF